MPPQEPSALKLWIDAATAFGTVAVAALAIWGDWFRAWLSPAKLVIEADSLRGQLVEFPSPTAAYENSPGITLHHIPAPPPAMWYVLKVVNKRRWQKCDHCRVLLVGLSRRGPDSLYHRVPFTVPRQFAWAPSESTPTEATIVRERIFDFGFVQKGTVHFTPTFYSLPPNFPGFVHKNESVRYFLQIEADNFSSPKYQVFEVSWDGEWHSHSEKMAMHLVIREVLDD
jgi:hypothetical protein